MNKKVVKNYIYNTLYQVLLLVAPLITTPYASRVLGVTNISIYHYAQSITTYFVLVGVVGTGLYGQREIAYLQAKPKERSKAFWEIEIFRMVSALFFAVVYFLIFCINGQYSVVYSILTLEIIAAAFDISWLFMGMEDFRVTVIRNMIIKISGIVLIFALVKSKDDLILFTICITAPTLIANISLWFNAPKYIEKIKRERGELLNGIKKRIRPILVLFLPQIARDIYLVLDKTMIGLLSSNIDNVGYYSQAQKIVKLTMALATSLGAVMLPAMSACFAKGDKEEIVKNIRLSFRFIYMLSIALMFGICAISHHFTPVFFGEGYDPVSMLMIVISPIIVIIATSNVVGTQYLLPTKQQKYFTISIIAGASVNLCLNSLLIPKYDAIGASVATVIAELTVAAVQCVYVRKQLPIKDFLLSGLRYILFGAIMMIAVRYIGTFLPKTVIGVVVMILFGGIVYLIELIITKDPMIKMGKNLFKKSDNR